MPGSAIATAFVLGAVAAGCVATPPREGVGGYCHRDDQCLEGLRCIELECLPSPASGSLEGAGSEPEAPPDAGAARDPR